MMLKIVASPHFSPQKTGTGTWKQKQSENIEQRKGKSPNFSSVDDLVVFEEAGGKIEEDPVDFEDDLPDFRGRVSRSG